MYIPKNIISDNTLQYNIHLALNILQYCQVHEDYTPINIQDARTKSAICLGPSGNTQCGFKLMSLHTANNFTIRIWDAIPMSDTVIYRVNDLEKGYPEHFVLTNQKGRIIGDSDITGVDTSGNQ